MNSIEDAKIDATSITSLINTVQYYGVKLDKHNKGLCPFHTEKTGSFSLKEINGKGYYKCFGCSHSGDAINFVQEKEGCDFVTALKKVCEINGRTLELEDNNTNATNTKSLERIKNILKDEVMYDKDHKPYYFENVYFYKDKDGSIVNAKVKYRASDNSKTFRCKGISLKDNSYIFTQDTQIQVIYNLPLVSSAIKEQKEVFLVEGEKDCDTLVALGYTATCFPSNGNYKKYIDTFKGATIIAITDNDEAGENHLIEWIEFLEEVVKNFYVINLPNIDKVGNKADITDWFNAGHTVEEFKTVILSSKFLPRNKNNISYKHIFNTYYYTPTLDKTLEITLEEKDGKPSYKSQVVYNGVIRIDSSVTDIDTREQFLILYSETFGYKGTLQMTKSELLTKNNYADILNLNDAFFVPAKDVKIVREYLTDYYTIQRKKGFLVSKELTQQIGWVKDEFIYPNTEMPISNKIFYNKDGKFNKIFNTKGTLEEYINNVLLPVMNTDIGVITISGVLASFLLEPLDLHESFVIDIFGKNSRGKTILLQALASMFAYPSKYVLEWNSTSNAVISNASEFKNFPLLLDDTKKCPKKEYISEVIYALTGGKEKARSQIDGSARELKTFKNVTFSTGETSILDYVTGSHSGAGVYARVLSIDTDNYIIFNTKEEADVINANTKKYYGVFGYQFLKWLSSRINKEEFYEIFDTYKSLNDAKVEHATSNRKAKHIALLQLAYQLLLEYLHSLDFLVEEKEEVLRNYLLSADKDSIEKDIYLQSYLDTIDYLRNNAQRVHTKSMDGHFVPVNLLGWLKDSKYYITNKNELKRILEMHGDFNDILKEWKRRNYLITNEGRLDKTARTPYYIDNKNKTQKVYCIDEKFYDEE